MILLLACRPPVVPIEPPSAEALLDAYAAQVDSRTTRSLRSSVRVQDLQGTLTETWVDGDYEAWLELSGLRMGWGLVDGVGWEKRPTWSRVWGPRLEELAFTAERRTPGGTCASAGVGDSRSTGGSTRRRVC